MKRSEKWTNRDLWSKSYTLSGPMIGGRWTSAGQVNGGAERMSRKYGESQGISNTRAKVGDRDSHSQRI